MAIHVRPKRSKKCRSSFQPI